MGLISRVSSRTYRPIIKEKWPPETKQEVINYKKEREIALKNLEMQIYGDKQNNEQHMAQKTENDIYNMQCMVQQNYHRVSELVTGLVFDVRPTLHVNYDGRE